MFVCLCKAVSEQSIRKLIAKGVKTVREIQDVCEAGTSCGTCLCSIADLLKEGDEGGTDYCEEVAAAQTATGS